MTEPAAPDCGDMIVISPERQGGVIFACTRQQGHKGEHANNGEADGYPLVENTAGIPFLLRWSA